MQIKPNNSLSNWTGYLNEIPAERVQQASPSRNQEHKQTNLFALGKGDGGTLGRILADIATCPAAMRKTKVDAPRRA